jgi:hypothetical protein
VVIKEIHTAIGLAIDDYDILTDWIHPLHVGYLYRNMMTKTGKTNQMKLDDGKKALTNGIT